MDKIADKLLEWMLANDCIPGRAVAAEVTGLEGEPLRVVWTAAANDFVDMAVRLYPDRGAMRPGGGCPVTPGAVLAAIRSLRRRKVSLSGRTLRRQAALGWPAGLPNGEADALRQWTSGPDNTLGDFKWHKLPRTPGRNC